MRKQRLKLPFRTAINNFTAVLYEKKECSRNITKALQKTCSSKRTKKENESSVG